ncbi:MAG: enterochelin esterase [Rhodobacterales bacterium]|nr:enterochelin esterase [Rhodobacterales bacterium]
MTRVLDLLKQIEADPAHTIHLVEHFLERFGSPMVQDGTATFFLRGPYDEVFLVHWVFGLESRIPFRRLPNTDVWCLSVELPESARIEYKFEVVQSGQRHWIKDPNNPHLAFDPFGANSVCRMGGYEDPSWVVSDPDVRPGTLDGFTLQSKVWGDERHVKVWVPHEYKAHKTYRLLVVHDGDDYLKYTGLQTVLDNLVHRHEVMPLVVAFTNGVNRNGEYGANPLHARFIMEDLVPAMESRFKISKDPRQRGLMGASFGGVASLFTAWQYPGQWGQLMLQSGSFVFTDIGHHGRSPLFDPVVAFTNEFREDPGRTGARIFLSCGVFESLISYNRSLVPLLRGAGVQHRFRESRDGHNWIGWRDRLRDGLTWTFPGHLWMTYD